MAKNENMIQCKLVRNETTSRVGVYYCWLPEKFAEVNRILEIDGMGDGWRVSEIYSTLPTAVVLERGQDYKKTRKASDI